MYDVDIATHPARRLAALVHTGPYNEISRAYQCLGTLLADRNLRGAAQGMIAVYYDDPEVVPETDLRSHAVVIVGESTPVEPPLEEVRLAGGRVAVLHFKGPYAGFQQAYAYLLGQWLAASGEKAAAGPCYEIYLNSPQDSAPEDLLTEICLPLA